MKLQTGNPNHWDIEKCPDGSDHDVWSRGGMKCAKCDVSVRMIAVRRNGADVESGWSEDGRTLRQSVIERLVDAHRVALENVGKTEEVVAPKPPTELETDKTSPRFGLRKLIPFTGGYPESYAKCVYEEIKVPEVTGLPTVDAGIERNRRKRQKCDKSPNGFHEWRGVYGHEIHQLIQCEYCGQRQGTLLIVDEAAYNATTLPMSEWIGERPKNSAGEEFKDPWNPANGGPGHFMQFGERPTGKITITVTNEDEVKPHVVLPPEELR